MAKSTRVTLSFIAVVLLITASCQMNYRDNFDPNSEFITVKCVSDLVKQFRGFNYKLYSEGSILQKNKVPVDCVFELNIKDSVYYQLEVTKKGFVTRNHYFFKHNILDTIKIEIQEVFEIY